MIVCYVKNQKLSIAQPQIVADSINYLECKFVFQTADWLNTAKIAHFSNGAIEYTVPLLNDKITADKHLNLSAGEWQVYVHGNGLISESRITTNVATLKVIESGIIGNPLPDVPLTWQEQAEERIKYLEQHGGGGGEGGENGATFIPNVSADGIISWTNDKRLPNPQPVNIKGKDGKDGKDGINGIDGYTPQKGIDYFDGENGRDGTSVSIVGIGESTESGGTSHVYFSDGKNVGIKNGKDGKTPQKGVDYFTDADKAEIVNSVKDAIPLSDYVQKETGKGLSTNDYTDTDKQHLAAVYDDYSSALAVLGLI